MSDFLALDWEKHQLSGLDAQVVRGRVTVRRCFRLAWPEDTAGADDAEQAGRWLKDELGRLGVRGRHVLVSLPREDVVVRQLEVPDVPEDELPELVRLQAETKASSSLDNMALDFLPLPDVASGVRHVLLATVPRERLERMRRTVEAAGLELVSVGISPVATAELISHEERRREDNPRNTSLLVTRHGPRVEISVIRDQRLLFTHSTQVSGQDPQQDGRLALAEIRRSQGALMRLDPGIEVRRAWVIGGDEESRGICDTLRGQLSCEVRAFDPLADADIAVETTVAGAHGPFAGPVGMLLRQTEATVEALDLLNPRRPVVRPDRRKLRWAVTAAGIALAAAAAYGGLWWQTTRLDAAIETKTARLHRMQQTVERGATIVRQADAVRQWKQRNVDMLEQLQSLRQAVGSSERMYLTDLRYVSSAGRTGERIRATGRSRTRDEVEQLYERLSARGYLVNPQEISRSSADDDYPFQFDLDIQISTKPEER